MDPWNTHRGFLVKHSLHLLECYRARTGRELIPAGSDGDRARLLWEAPFVVVSAGPEDDPRLNYGNAAALELWEMDWDCLTATPARQTAEPVHQAEREAFLQRVREQGYVDDYSGIRISATGRRFRIEQALVWNLDGPGGGYGGQAATFSRWTPV